MIIIQNKPLKRLFSRIKKNGYPKEATVLTFNWEDIQKFRLGV